MNQVLKLFGPDAKVLNMEDTRGMPDYVDVSAGLGPIFNADVKLDREFRLHLAWSGVELSQLKSPKGWSVGFGATFGWLLQDDTPNDEQLSSSLDGDAVGFNAGYGVGAGYWSVPGSDAASMFELSIRTPGFTGGVSHTRAIIDLWPRADGHKQVPREP